MPAKHSTRPFSTARIVMSGAVAILVLLVVWVAVRAVGPAEASRQPTVVLPAMPQLPVNPPAGPAPAVTSALAVPTTAAPSVTPSAGSPTPRTATTTPPPTAAATTAPPTPQKTVSKSPKPPAPTTASPAPRKELKASVNVTASWDEGYVAAVRVENTGEVAADWRVTLNHAGQDNQRLRGTWNAQGDQQGNSFVFTGGTLAPGASAVFGYQSSKSGRGKARPTGCSVVGGACGMR